MSDDDFAAAVTAYLDCAVWTESSDRSVWDPELRAYGRVAVATFSHSVCDILPTYWQHATPDQLGHDLWLTRHGHGTGFWDRGLPGTLGEVLSREARAMGDDDDILSVLCP